MVVSRRLLFAFKFGKRVKEPTTKDKEPNSK
jgi:hypothetical protein